jgi:hypothetical protein
MLGEAQAVALVKSISRGAGWLLEARNLFIIKLPDWTHYYNH